MTLATMTLALATKKPKSQKPDFSLTRASRSTRRRGLETIVEVWVRFWRDRVAQDADSFHLNLYDVPRFEIASRKSVAYRLADRAAGNGASAKNVARNQSAIP